MWAAARGVVVACSSPTSPSTSSSPVHGFRLPRSIAAIDLLLTLALVTGTRLLARTVIERPAA